MKEKLKYALKERVFYIAAVVLALNMEAIVIPFILKPIGLSGLDLKIAAGVWATVEIIFWYWFSGWVGRWFKNLPKVQEAVEDAKGIKEEAERRGILTYIKNWIWKHLLYDFSPDNYKQKKLFSFLFRVGYVIACLFMFFLGAMPFFWIFALMVCRAKNWKIGFFALALGNLLKNVLFAHGWDYVWPFLWRWTV